MEEKTPLLEEKTPRCLISTPQNKILRSWNQKVRKNFFLKNYITSERDVSYNVLYYEPFSITYQVSFYASNYFDNNSVHCL